MAGGDKFVQDAIRDVFVEDAFIAELLQIQFKALQLDAFFIRDIAKNECSEVGLSRFGTHRCEFGAGDFDLIFAIGKAVVENFEQLLKRSTHWRKISFTTGTDHYT